MNGADGVVRNGTISKDAFRNASSTLTTPSATLRWLRIFFLMRSHPPLLYQEGSFAGLRFIHNFVRFAVTTPEPS